MINILISGDCTLMKLASPPPAIDRSTPNERQYFANYLQIRFYNLQILWINLINVGIALNNSSFNMPSYLFSNI